MQTNKTIHHFKRQVQKGGHFILKGNVFTQDSLSYNRNCYSEQDVHCVFMYGLHVCFLYFFVHVFIYIDVFLFCLFYFVYAHSDVAFYLLGANDTDTRLLLLILFIFIILFI